MDRQAPALSAPARVLMQLLVAVPFDGRLLPEGDYIAVSAEVAERLQHQGRARVVGFTFNRESNA